ncbi:MAG: CRISPR-associated protein Cas5 [Syntrophorhabdus sp. PtaU1.Bin153]|nr:MAG: CRISPR-associated protein Cas5 [Syntrophorhabdus sp. PtaU1.Bin153]
MNTLISKNSIEFRLWGRYALFADPLTKIGGEKCSYHLPTYEALKGVCKSIYWKPTIIWVVDAVRVMKRIRTQTKGTKPLEFSGGNTLSIYTFLFDVEYQVRANFIWNENHNDLEQDRIDGKHYAIAKRMLERGGRQDIFLGTRDCQGYVEPCTFGESEGAYDRVKEIGYGLMFHGFDYPDETGSNELYARFWYPKLEQGVLTFERPDDCPSGRRKFVRKMSPKTFGTKNVKSVELEAEELEVMG